MNKPSKQPCGWCKRLTGAYLLMTALSPAVFAAQEEVRPLETTTAYELLVLESSVRQVPQGAEQLLHSAINDATTAALQTRSPLKTREEALAVLEAIQLALVKYNFLQPPEEKDWPQTLGDALKPRTFAPEALKAILSYSRNVRRAKYIDQTKPFYFVDCDMGAQLFLAVGERLGWDIRLVEIPQHNFVRWHLSESLKINWDWTRWESVDDSVYFAEIPTPEDHRLRALYLRSFEPKEARAYYLGLIGSEASLPSDGERLLQEAVKVLPNHPLTLNNLAWLYATNPEFAKHKSDLAVAYSLAAWSMRHNYGNFADTVACAFAADGASQLAGKIEEFAMEHPNNPAQRETFRKNRDRIMKGMLCNP